MTIPLTSTVIMLGSNAADSNACTGATLPINCFHRECRPLQPWRLMQSQRTALNRRPRVQTNRLLLPGTDPAPIVTATEPWPLSP